MARKQRAGRGRWIRGVVFTLAMAAGLSGCGAAAPDSEPAPSAAPLAVGSAGSRSAPGRPIALVAEGTGDAAWVLPPAVPPLPPGLEFRARYTYPAADDDDLLDLQVFLTWTGAPTGLPIAPGFLITHLRIQVDRFQVSRLPEPNLLITGTVRSVPVPSPFGATVGRLVAITGGFAEGATTTFTMLGGPVAGSHSTTLPSATGSITFARRD